MTQQHPFSSPRRLDWVVPPQCEGTRVDTLLKKHMGLSGTVVRRIKWLEDGILADGVRVNTRYIPKNHRSDSHLLQRYFCGKTCKRLLRRMHQQNLR